LEAVFSVRSVPRLYNEGHLALRESSETAVRRVGDWWEMAVSMRGREPGSREMSTVTLPSSAVKTVTENTTLCVTVICKVYSRAVC
jgi:hypothetical protein